MGYDFPDFQKRSSQREGPKNGSASRGPQNQGIFVVVNVGK